MKPDPGQRILSLRKKVDHLRSDKARAEGALQGLLERMKEELGHDNPEEVTKERKRLAREVAQLETELADKMEGFLQEFGEHLEDGE